MLILQYAPGLWNGGKLWRSAPQHSAECREHSGVVPTASAQAEEPDTIIGCVVTVSTNAAQGIGTNTSSREGRARGHAVPDRKMWPMFRGRGPGFAWCLPEEAGESHS